MPLSPPPDYTKVLFCACVGVASSVIVHLGTRSTLPSVGDNIHSLPHGGLYRDGTKQIAYCSPKGLNSIEKLSQSAFSPWSVVLFLIALIAISHWVDSKRCARCSNFHA
uniref:Movement protein TGB2 n=1 Tax=Potato virus H TaxID=1046402 RepID=I6M3V8_9VIRU|nr:12K protein [Potato virus H]